MNVRTLYWLKIRWKYVAGWKIGHHVLCGPLHVAWHVSFGCWITWSISSWQEHYKSAFLFTKAEWWVNNISRWLFYYTKLLVKRGKNSGQMGVKTCVTKMVRMSPRKPALWKCIISGVRYRSKFWYLRRKPAVMFSKWVFFQNSLLL